MTLRLATPEQIERAKTPADTDDFIAWFMAQRQDRPDHRTEYQRNKSKGDS